MEWRLEHAPFLPQVELAEIVADFPAVSLINPGFQGGNVSPEELVAIASLVAQYRPTTSVEIGTFDGNTTLQIAANSAPDGNIFSLDLPLENAIVPAEAACGDGQFILSDARQQRKFKGSSFAARIKEIYGDSKTFDFQTALAGATVDLAFIDGSHSYEYVRNDTERIIPLLSRTSVIIWHDYCRSWPGVVRYLNELGKSHPLVHIAGTSVVFWARDNRSNRQQNTSNLV